METKQVIVIRKDLAMRKGKMIAQGAHASMKVILDKMSTTYIGGEAVDKRLYLKKENPMYHWIQGLFTKVVVGCNSKEELYELAEKAAMFKIPFAVIEDAGLTEFHGEKTVTALAIGPDEVSKIDEITGHLKLL